MIAGGQPRRCGREPRQVRKEATVPYAACAAPAITHTGVVV